MSDTADQNTVRSLIENLRAAAARADQDDLGALAQMHGWCEVLAGLEPGCNPGPNPRVAEKASDLARLIETLILHAAPDPQAAFQTVVEKVEDLAALAPESGREERSAAADGAPATAVNDGMAHLQELVNQLSALASCMSQDDVQVLTRMQDLCGCLAESARSNTLPLVAEHATLLAGDIRRLLLRDVEDTDSACVAITEAIGRLSDAVMNAFEGRSGTIIDKLADECLIVQSDECARTRANALSDAQDAGEPGYAGIRGAAGSDAVSPLETATQTGPDGTAAAPEDGGIGPAYQPEPLILDNNDLEFVKTFVEEAREHIETIEQALLEAERSPTSLGRIADLFQPFHIIRGMAGFLRLRDVHALTQETETVLDQARKGERPVTLGLIDVLFNVIDILKAQVSSLNAHLAAPTGRPVLQPPVAHMIGFLRDIVAGRIQPDARWTPSAAPGRRIGEALVEQGAVAPEVVEFALETQKAAAGEKKIGEILMEIGAVNARQVGRALRAQGLTAGAPDAAAVDTSMAIKPARLDRLIDALGELAVAQDLVQANRSIAGDLDLFRDVDRVSKLIRHVREVAKALRLVPVGPILHEAARPARDLSRRIGKQVNLAVSGEDTEIDRNLLQQVGDSLARLLCYAVEQGIEPPEQRIASGKLLAGELWLYARHDGDSIVLEIGDDGRGLDAQSLIAQGIEKGLVQPGDQLTEQQALGLLMRPGFAAAPRLDDATSPAVGLDVVRRDIEQLGGTVNIASEPGRGTTFTIRLPQLAADPLSGIGPTAAPPAAPPPLPVKAKPRWRWWKRARST